jgi:hypothetical protein
MEVMKAAGTEHVPLPEQNAQQALPGLFPGQMPEGADAAQTAAAMPGMGQADPMINTTSINSKSPDPAYPSQSKKVSTKVWTHGTILWPFRAHAICIPAFAWLHMGSSTVPVGSTAGGQPDSLGDSGPAMNK